MRIVIMAGGSGSRLWPLSRSLHPKQFLPLVGERTMLQSTLDRVSGLLDEPPIIICNEEHRFIVAEQVRDLGLTAEILLEPAGRNTAPAIALSALQATVDGCDPLLLVLSADHVIRDKDDFCQQVKNGVSLAEKGALVTFGVTPTSPETGYGYIRQGKSVEDGGFSVAEFVEKPDINTAEGYVSSGEYFWNSGMFLFSASRYLQELSRLRPDIFRVCEESFSNKKIDLDFIRVDPHKFLSCPDESIDYAVMEKLDSAVVMPLSSGWNDVGAWASIWDESEKDENFNVKRGDVVELNTKRSFIHSTSRLVATIGLNDVVVVETADAVLVAAKESVQDVKKIVEHLKRNDRRESELHREVYRPWGRYDSIDQGARYQVKRITVESGRKLSVQKHHHRAEHWVVVSGTALVQRGDEELIVSENESVYIPVGVVHSLENPGKIPLELIEVQSGSYLGEDDIVRLGDKYGRS